MVLATWLERQGLLKIIPYHALLWRTKTDGIREAAGTRQSAIVLHTLAYHLGFLRNMYLRLQNEAINGISSPSIRDDYFPRCKFGRY
jgi:hypothetical protein